MRAKLSALFLFILLVLASTLGSVSAQNAPAKWSIFVYIAGENNLEPAALNDLIEMQNVGSNADVNIVVEMDRSPAYATASGDWTDTRRFLVQYAPPAEYPDAETMRQTLIDTFTRQFGQLTEEDLAFLTGADEATLRYYYRELGLIEELQQKPLQRLGETNTGDPANFQAFLEWGLSNFPAERYAVIVWNHGGGWTGIGPDDGSLPGILNPREIDQVLGKVRQRFGIEKFDLIGFDACLMSQLEVYQFIAPHGRYAVAAQEVVPNEGYNYDAAIAALQADPRMGGDVFGQHIVDTFAEHYETVRLDSTTDIHLIDLSQIEAVSASLAAFAQAAQADPVAVLNAIGLSRNSARVFGAQDPNSEAYFSSVDLISFMNLMVGQETAPEIREVAQAVLDSATAAVLYTRAGENSVNANGLAIYFPFTADVFALGDNNTLYPQSITEAMLPWVDFLNSFHLAAEESLTPEGLVLDLYNVVTFGDTASYNLPPTLLYSTEGAGVISFKISALLDFEDFKMVMAETPLVYNYFDDAGNLINYFPSEYQENYYTWDVQIPTVTQGEEAIPILLRFSKDYLRATVRGEYHFSDGTVSQANLVFDTATQSLLSAWSITETGEGTVTSQITISQNDIFFPYYEVLIEGELAATTLDGYLLYLNQPINYTFGPAWDGLYTLRLEMQDMAGNLTVDEMDVMIDNSTSIFEGRGFVSLQEGITFLFPSEWADATFQSFENDTYRWVMNSLDGLQNILYEPRYDLATLDELLVNAQEYLAGFDSTVGEPVALELSGYPAYIIPYEYQDGDVYYYAQLGLVYSDHPNTGGYWLDVYADTPEGLNLLSALVFNNLLLFEPFDTTKPQ